jgi:sorbitol-specific phosphotransferase system component IIBC
VGLAVLVSFALTAVGGVLVHGYSPAAPEAWGIMTLQMVAVASFSSLMSVLIRRWAILPTSLFFMILGNSASGGAVSPRCSPARSRSSPSGCRPARP